MKKLILASKSPRRQKILKDNGFVFESIPAEIDEESFEYLNPLEMVKLLSKLKAEKISKSYPDAIVIGADTTINLNGKIISKPKDLEDAKRILSELSGTTHEVITAFTIIYEDKNETFSESSFVTFHKLTESNIKNYINSTDVLEFAGAYGIQDGADIFVEKFEGDNNNIVGLPTIALEKLKKIFI